MSDPLCVIVSQVRVYMNPHVTLTAPTYAYAGAGATSKKKAPARQVLVTHTGGACYCGQRTRSAAYFREYTKTATGF